MKKTIIMFLAMAGLASAQIEVSVAGLRVIGKGHKSEEDGNNINTQLRAFNWTEGTAIGLLLVSKEKSIVDMDDDGSKITTFLDDQGTDFTKAKGRFGRGGVDFGFPKFSNDKKALIAEINTSGIPAKGSKEITLKGELLVSVASKSEMKKSKATEAKKEGKVMVGEHSFEMTKVGKPDWGDDPFAISFKGQVNPKQFKQIKFFDAEGNELESDRSSSGSMGGFGKKTYTVTYNFKKKVDQFILGLDGWTDLEVIKVPLDLKFGAGL